MQLPAWFDAVYYAAQKAEQMNAIAWKDSEGNPKTDWQASDWPGELARFNAENHTDFTAFDNFLSCNAANYAESVGPEAINVSPNQYFKVPVYLTNLANYFNASGFAAHGHAVGQWNAETALSYLFEEKRISAWEHFRTEGFKLGLNPSNDFDTAAYLEARTGAMGSGATVEDAIAAIDAAGLNPIQDYFVWGKSHHIKATPAANYVEPDITAGAIWGDKQEGGDKPAVPPPSNGNQSNGGSGSSGSGSDNNPETPPVDQPEDPPADQPQEPLPDLEPIEKNDQYDQDTIEQEISGNAVVESPAGQNTIFSGDFDVTPGAESVNPETVIRGGEDAHNSLELTLGADWPGFGQSIVDGEVTPNVTNIGRVVLSNSTNESLDFNAKNIAGLEQLDIDNNGKPAISVSALPESVNCVTIKNINGSSSEEATVLAFEKTPKRLQVGVENVCADGEAAASINVKGIAQLELASNGSGNSVNLAEAEGIRRLVITQGADLSIADSNGSTIEEYDASRTSSAVNLGVSNFKDGAVVKGGKGNEDSLTFNDFTEVNEAQWTGVENIVFNDGGEINAADASGIENIWQMGSAPLTVSNLASKELTIYDAGTASPARAASSQTNVTGEIDNIIYRSCGMKERPATIDANFASNATGDCLITTQGGDKIGVTSSFELPELTGTITINDPNPTDQKDYTPIIDGIKLQAENATGLHVIHTGSMRICGALWKVQNIKAELTNHPVPGLDPDLFKLPELPSASNIDIAADNMDIYITALGYETNFRDMDLKISDANSVQIGGLYSAANIDAVIDSDFTEIKEIHAKGDLNLTISGKYLEMEENGFGVNDGFIGAAVNLDFSRISGDVGSTIMSWGDYTYGMMADVEALGGSLTYKGAAGADNLLVGGLTGGTHSTVATGSGNDEVVVQTLKSIAEGQQATLDIDLGSGENILRVYNMNQTGNLVVNVTGAANGLTAIYKECGYAANISNVSQANLALEAIGAGFELDANTQISKGVFEYGGNAYWLAAKFTGSQAHSITLIAAEGCTAEMIMDDDL